MAQNLIFSTGKTPGVVTLITTTKIAVDKREMQFKRILDASPKLRNFTKIILTL